ncbi:putative sugar kinase YDR109C OS=Saccharomyces cerevisiae (strain ATCC 204508 / S288c) GN=YDR109C PE=1 SV=1 [Rhizoctonia solani AG-1 IB]|uniref:Putative sugar kinase YDR109C n=1 Tax=Thanatephorus cucumeris (strain AG1-IB / isolate 7/3/14) TaxID=1108050 RepID=A0A0B7FB35_THACB|nr:putative sugar kinase YDR109C OS=Saccharomyces cerevisiae (strain ATCC 204508 / S288c) GN=YDR109C PE=1 SV=1 [Rhizoctonia solani AG-1 IB]
MSTSTGEKYYLGVDVGTGSARAALVSRTGQLLASSTQATTTWRSDTDSRIFEQSTTEIWNRICTATRECLVIAKVSPSDVAGIGFDATCSLAVTDRQGEPVCVTGGKELGGKGERNIVLWADHRAEQEAGIINSSGAVVLDYVGGTMSLEMEIPKILWLSRHMSPEKFAQCQFFDLPDWLTYKSTGSQARSTCSLTCKCSFVPPGATEAAHGWVPEFFKKIGLGSLVDDGFAALGGWGVTAPSDKNGDPGIVLTAGQPVGHGLTKQAAEELGLVEGTPVGSAVIDAYAGWIGTVAARYKTGSREELSPAPGLDASGERLAAVAGTSTCHVIQSPKGIFVPGVWGPYKNAVFPGWWMNEGGQSSTGQLIDFVLTTHAAYPRLQILAKEQQKSVHIVLAEQLEALRLEAGADSLVELTKDVHFYPDLHGNRSPLADPQMRGSIVGLKLDSGLGDLALKFNVTLEAIALQTRHIVETMNARGHTVRSIFMSGGQAANIKLMQLFADTIGVPVILPQSHSAAVVLGAAMLGRFAAEVVAMESATGSYAEQKVAEEASEKTKEDLWKIMVEMTPPGKEVSPNASPRDSKLLDAKYSIFLEAIDIQRRWRREMAAAAAAGQ